MAGFLPEIALRLTAAAMAGKAAEAKRIEEELAPLWALFKAHGSLRVVFAMARQMGLTDCDPPRPILPLDDATRREIAAATEPLARYGLPHNTPIM